MGRDVLFNFGVEAGVHDEQAVFAGLGLDRRGQLRGVAGQDVAAFGEDLLPVVLAQFVGLGVPLLFEVSLARRL